MKNLLKITRKAIYQKLRRGTAKGRGSAVNYLVHSHCGGISVFPKALSEEIQGAIKGIDIFLKNGVATNIRDEFLTKLRIAGWSGELVLSPESNITITSSKNGVGLCCQTGNMARMYADLLKLQALYLNGVISCGAYILPSSPVAAKLGSNIANATRLERELDIFKKVYNLPTLVFSLEE